MTYLLNLSITQGVFPNELKLAKIIPLYKAGNKSSIDNYRPISVLPYFSKLYERIMYNRVIQFIEIKNILYACQFGFRKKHSTGFAISYIVNKIHDGFNNHNCTLGVFLDFSKAFDTVDHSILLQKLEHYGIRGLALSWFKSYLSCKKQFVSINNCCSDYQHITCGVPQGSILGPLLFLLYINDLAYISQKLCFVMFADDSNVFLSGSNINEMILTMNDELLKVTSWLNSNKLSLNVDKSKHIIFSVNNVKPEKNVIINDTVLEKVTDSKFLGIVIDYKLSWKQHILYVKSKLSKHIAILYKARKVLCCKSLITLYYSFIYPFFTYGLEIWGRSYITEIESLFRLQKKIVRIITSSKYYDHTEPLFASLKLMPLSRLYEYRMIMFLFKYHNSQVPTVLNDIFLRNSDVHRYNTRNADSFIVPEFCNEIFKRSFIYNGVVVYNKAIKHFDFSVSFAFPTSSKIFLS